MARGQTLCCLEFIIIQSLINRGANHPCNIRRLTRPCAATSTTTRTFLLPFDISLKAFAFATSGLEASSWIAPTLQVLSICLGVAGPDTSSRPLVFASFGFNQASSSSTTGNANGKRIQVAALASLTRLTSRSFSVRKRFKTHAFWVGCALSRLAAAIARETKKISLADGSSGIPNTQHA